MKHKLLLFLLILLMPFIAFSTTLIPMGDINLIHRSDEIVVGVIMDSWTEWENGNIFTYATLDIEQHMQGFSDCITLKSIGGAYEDTIQSVIGSPDIGRIGQRVVVFVTNDGLYGNIVGWSQGFLEVDENQMIPSRGLSLIQYLKKLDMLMENVK